MGWDITMPALEVAYDPDVGTASQRQPVVAAELFVIAVERIAGAQRQLKPWLELPVEIHVQRGIAGHRGKAQRADMAQGQVESRPSPRV